MSHRSVFGGRSLDVSFDHAARVVRVQEVELQLHDHNVVLVDDIDASASRPAIETRRLDTKVSGSPLDVERFIASSPELVQFLRCEAIVPDPAVQQMMDKICNRIGHR